MFDTFALLLSDVDQALGHPDRSHLDPEDVARAACETLAFYGLSAQGSEYARQGKYVPVTFSSRDARINSNEILFPSYIERRSGTTPNEVYEWIPSTSLSELEEFRMKNQARAAFYKGDNGEWRVRLSYDPTGIPHRLRYYSDPLVVSSINDPLPLSARFGFMFSARALINTVPMMMQRNGKLANEAQLSVAQLNAIGSAVALAQSQIKDWDPIWKQELHADKNPQGRNRRRLVP